MKKTPWSSAASFSAQAFCADSPQKSEEDKKWLSYVDEGLSLKEIQLWIPNRSCKAIKIRISCLKKDVDYTKVNWDKFKKQNYLLTDINFWQTSSATEGSSGVFYLISPMLFEKVSYAVKCLRNCIKHAENFNNSSINLYLITDVNAFIKQTNSTLLSNPLEYLKQKTPKFNKSSKSFFIS